MYYFYEVVMYFLKLENVGSVDFNGWEKMVGEY